MALKDSDQDKKQGSLSKTQMCQMWREHNNHYVLSPPALWEWGLSIVTRAYIEPATDQDTHLCGGGETLWLERHFHIMTHSMYICTYVIFLVFQFYLKQTSRYLLCKRQNNSIMCHADWRTLVIQTLNNLSMIFTPRTLVQDGFSRLGWVTCPI